MVAALGEDFARDFDALPETTIAVVSAALRSLLGDDSCVGRLTVRVIDYPETYMFSDLRSCLLGRFVQVKGTVVRVNPVSSPPAVLTFRCLRCTQIIVQPQPPNSHYTPPKKCPTHQCPSKQFSLERTSPETILRNRQSIK